MFSEKDVYKRQIITTSTVNSVRNYVIEYSTHQIMNCFVIPIFPSCMTLVSLSKVLGNF